MDLTIGTCRTWVLITSLYRKAISRLISSWIQLLLIILYINIIKNSYALWDRWTLINIKSKRHYFQLLFWHIKLWHNNWYAQTLALNLIKNIKKMNHNNTITDLFIVHDDLILIRDSILIWPLVSDNSIINNDILNIPLFFQRLIRFSKYVNHNCQL